MDNNSKEKNKSLRRAMTAEKLTEMLKRLVDTGVTSFWA